MERLAVKQPNTCLLVWKKVLANTSENTSHATFFAETY